MTTPAPLIVQSLVIEVDEMGFAIALFVAAAGGKVLPPNRQTPDIARSREQRTSDPLLLGAQVTLREDEGGTSGEVPLACAVAVLWHHYENDLRQQSICSRLVAFYSLMVRRRGVLFEPWLIGGDTGPESITLSSGLVQAVATAPISEDGQFTDSDFKISVQAVQGRGAGSIEPSAAASRATCLQTSSVAAIPLTRVVEQLSLHLYAFQSCVAFPHTDGLRFRAIEQLCRKLASVNGNTGLQAMLSRALVAIESDFPWLQSARATSAGTLEGLERVHPTPDPKEAMRCELALLGSLIELLRSFSGDGVTLKLLRSLWPLASLEISRKNKS